MCILVVGIYSGMAHSGAFELLSPGAADTYYNLLVRGFGSHQLSLSKPVPAGFTRLVDPYDSTANALYRSAAYQMQDMSYYKGRLYLYFGATPALILLWPFAALTGEYLFNRQAVLFFCIIGFLASAGLLHALWRRYFERVSVLVVAACTLALGLATIVPVLLSRCEVYEVAISCGYMLLMLALGAIWCALHEPERRNRWLALASLAYGLAIGARPNLLFGAVILLVPVVQAWREHQRIWVKLLAAIGPIMLVGFGLMLYNFLRFGNPLEFGQTYQLVSDRPPTGRYFSLHYFWFNSYLYFLKPACWIEHFHLARKIIVPLSPVDHGLVETPFGILTDIPLMWLALAAPLAWRGRPCETQAILRRFLAALVMLFGASALTIGFFYGASIRYEVEFLPTLLLLAVVGILGLELALADRPFWRNAARLGGGVLLGVSVTFNVLGGLARCAETHNTVGVILERTGHEEAAIEHLEYALHLRPDYAEAHYNLGIVLGRAGRLPEAISHFKQALRIAPDDPETNYQLGIALGQAGRLPEAAGYMERALQTRPDNAEAQYNLGVILVRLGRVQEAMAHWEQALRIKPDYAEAHYNLGVGLERAGKIKEAIKHYEQALRIRPDYAEARNMLQLARRALPRPQEGGTSGQR